MRRYLLTAILSVGVIGTAWADAQGDLKQGRDALRRGDYATAVTRTTAAIEAQTLQGERLAEAFRTRAAAQFQLRDLRSAFADVSQALALNPADASALALRCQIHVAGGNLQAAQGDLQSALSADARSGAAQVCQAGLHIRQRQFAEAVAAYDRAIAAGEDTPGLRAERATALAMAGRPQDAIAALDQVIAGSRSAAPAQRAEWLVDRARLNAAVGRRDAALKDLEQAIRLDPEGREQSERLFLRARLHNDAGQHDRALSDLNRAIGLEQNAPDGRKALLFATRGSTYAAKGDFAWAIADIDGAIGLGREVPPQVVASWYAVRGRINEAAGRPDAALQDFDTAVRLAPSDVGYLGERGSLHLRRGSTDQALADFQTAAQQAPNNPLPQSWLAWAYVDKGDYARAVDLASRVIQMRPNEPVGYFDRGVFQLYLGRFAEATADLDQAVQLAPRNANAVLLAHVARARAGAADPTLLAQRARALDLGRWPGPLLRMFLGELSPEQALQAAGREGDRQGRMAEANYYVGEYYLISGQPQYAAELFRRAVDTNRRDMLEHLAAWTELNRLGG